MFKLAYKQRSIIFIHFSITCRPLMLINATFINIITVSPKLFTSIFDLLRIKIYLVGFLLYFFTVLITL
jgi:hypothetical protein